mmetsp:Transcript_12737/g.29272  ORF Transcript_12737/g.29272 Transcript_12737/m.29272 type:complete len:221 (-) Transcript_12737:97-759(-)
MMTRIAVLAAALAAAPSVAAPDAGPAGPDGSAPRRSLQYNSCAARDAPPPSSLSSSRSVIDAAMSHIRRHRSTIEEGLFRSKPFWNATYTVPSTEYRYEDFESALKFMATTGVEDDAGRGRRKKFWLGPDNCNDDGYVVGLANVAAFLGQSAATVIANDTCDELNWEFVATGVEDSGNGAYPLSNACGQGPVHSGRLFPATAPDAFVRMRSSPPFILQSR